VRSTRSGSTPSRRPKSRRRGLGSKGATSAPLRTLLYVEDNPANVMLVEQLIARFPDLRLLTAANGTLGVELTRTALPQMILMDINLLASAGSRP